MKRSAYYEEMKALARQTRAKYALSSARVLKSDLRRIYKDNGIRIDLWPHKFRQLRGAYFNDEMGPTVVIAKGLPVDPTVFTMGHELKHHLADRGLGITYCASGNENEPIEIGAEVLAAELIFPEADFIDRLASMGIGHGRCTSEALVRLKHDTGTTLSYAGLAKRAEFLGLAAPGSLSRVKWRTVEESLYGKPFFRLLPWRRPIARLS